MIREEALSAGSQLSLPRLESGLLAVVASGALDVTFRGAFWQLRPGWALWTSGTGLESVQAWEETRVLRLEWDSPSDTRLFAASILLRESMARLAESDTPPPPVLPGYPLTPGEAWSTPSDRNRASPGVRGYETSGWYPYRDTPLERALLAVIRDEAERSWSIPLTAPWPRGAWLEKAAIVLRDVGPDEASIEWLAGKMEMSARSLSRRFSRETGLSPFDWRRHARVIEAVRLMSLGVQMQDIVPQVGFRSRNALTEAFQQQFGLPPARFWRGFSGS